MKIDLLEGLTVRRSLTVRFYIREVNPPDLDSGFPFNTVGACVLANGRVLEPCVTCWRYQKQRQEPVGHSFSNVFRLWQWRAPMVFTAE